MITNNRIIFKILIFQIISLILIHNKAQSQTIDEKVTVIGSYNPEIQITAKLSPTPTINFSDFKVPEMNFKMNDFKKEFKPVPNKMNAAKFESEPSLISERNYFKAGIGNYLTPYAEFWANSLPKNSKKSKIISTIFGFHAKHLSSNGNIKGYSKSSYSENALDFNLKHFFINHTLNFDAFYNRNVNYFYRKTSIFNDSIKTFDEKQVFNRVGVNANLISNYFDDNKINHVINFKYNLIKDNYFASESSYKLKFNANKKYKLFELTDSQSLGIESKLFFYKYNDTLLSQLSKLFTFEPFISTNFDEYFLKAGFKISIISDTNTSLHLHPFIAAKVNALNNNLALEAGITGGVEKFGVDDISFINPFLKPGQSLEYTNNKLKFYAIAKAKINDFISFSVSFNTGITENEPLFVNDTSMKMLNSNKFLVIYDKLGFISGNIGFILQIKDYLKLISWADMHSYTTEREDKAWHKPTFILGSNLSYSYTKNYIFKIGFLYESGRFAKEFDIDKNKFYSKKLKNIFDINLSFEYRYSKFLSGWINLSNLTFERQYYWNNYPTQKFRAMIGISYCF